MQTHTHPYTPMHTHAQNTTHTTSIKDRIPTTLAPLLLLPLHPRLGCARWCWQMYVEEAEKKTKAKGAYKADDAKKAAEKASSASS